MIDLNILPVDNKTIGLSISGGADSAVLAYLLMLNVKQPLHFFIYASKQKNNKTVINSISVINKCQELTQRKDVHIHIRYAATQERNEFFDYLIESVDNGTVDIMYTGTTSTPPLSVLTTFNDILPQEFLDRRDPVKVKPNWTHSNKMYHPLINLDKKDIATLYKDLNLLEELYPITGSCESTELVVGHCKVCWWCQERIWAFGTT